MSNLRLYLQQIRVQVDFTDIFHCHIGGFKLKRIRRMEYNTMHVPFCFGEVIFTSSRAELCDLVGMLGDVSRREAGEISASRESLTRT